jgi:hypothetical protein
VFPLSPLSRETCIHTLRSLAFLSIDKSGRFFATHSTLHTGNTLKKILTKVVDSATISITHDLTLMLQSQTGCE